MKNEETLYRRAYDFILDQMPDPPPFDELRLEDVQRTKPSPRAGWVFAGAGTLVLLLIGGTSLLFPGAVGPAVSAVAVEHLVVEYKQVIDAPCAGGQVSEVDGFDEFDIDLWIDRSTGQRRAEITYPDGSHFTVVGVGDPLTSVYSLGQPQSRQLECFVGEERLNQPRVWDDPINLANWGLGSAPFFVVQPEERIEGPVTDSVGREAIQFRGSVTGFAVDNEGSERPLEQMSDRFVGIDGELLEWVWHETVADTFQVTQQATVIDREAIEVNASLFDTDLLELVIEIDPTVTTISGTPTTSEDVVPPTISEVLDVRAIGDGVSVVDLRMDDGTRLGIFLPTSLVGGSVSLTTAANGALIGGDTFTASLSYQYCAGEVQDTAQLNNRGAAVTPMAKVVCRADQFLVLEIETDVEFTDDDLDDFDIVVFAIGQDYASATESNLGGICCDDFGPLMSGDLIVTANRFTSGLVTAWDRTTLIPQWTYDLGESSFLLGVNGDLVLTSQGGGSIVALDVLSGVLAWEAPIEGTIVGSATGPDQNIWFVSSDFSCEGCVEAPHVAAVDVTDGSVVWDAAGMPGTTWQWSDPAVFSDVIVVMDVPSYLGEGVSLPSAHLRAFDISTGGVRWTTDLEDTTEGFSDRLIIHDPIRNILIAATPSGWVFSINPDTGAVLWRTETGFGRIAGLEDDAVLIEQAGIIRVDLFTGERQ